MNDYAARILHDDKTKSWRHQADEARRASAARGTGQMPADAAPRTGLIARLAVRASDAWRHHVKAYRLRSRLAAAADSELGKPM